jgi:hypothetical protein
VDDTQIIWDLEDDEDGNYWHIVVEGHGITQEEVEEVLLNRSNETTRSREHDSMATFGWTSTGKHILVAWEHVQDDPLTIYPITAYEVPERRGRSHE